MISAWQGSPPASLLDTCLGALADNIERVEHLSGISEELALALFDDVLRLGKLSPKVRTGLEQDMQGGRPSGTSGFQGGLVFDIISGVVRVKRNEPVSRACFYAVCTGPRVDAAIVPQKAKRSNISVFQR